MDSLAERIEEARQSGKLNLSYLGAAAVEDAVAQLAAAPPGALRISELDLSSNALDAWPAALASGAHTFAGIRLLRAKYNRLARLPTEQLLALPLLNELDLEGNLIAALEDGALLALGSLRCLNLGSNGLVALPESVAGCRCLEALTLSNNPLTQLPDGLGACPVTHLDVSSCRLVALPAALAQCRTLQRFFCQNNDLPRVPTALAHLSGLKEWNLRANKLPLKWEQARERGLAKFLAFLREEEEIERLQAVLEDAVMAGRAGEPTDGFAWIRSGHATAQHSSQVFVFGGVVVKEGRKTSELLVLNTDSMSWRVQPTRGDRPCPRDGHALVVDPSGGAAGQLICFGGRNASGRRLNDLHALDLATWTWFNPRQEGAALPAPREQAAAAFSPDGRLLLFGGRTNGARLNDLWSWDAQSGLWELLPAHGTAPSPRQGAAACVSGAMLYIMGGSSNFVLQDCLAYNLDTQEWAALSIEGQSKGSARAGGHIITWQQEKEGEATEGSSGGPGGGCLYLFGGRDALGAHVSYLLKLKARGGGSWYEWVETQFVMQPNRSRIMLFDSSGRLDIVQCGHPLHKLSVAPEAIEKGSCVWDVVQQVPLAAIQEKEVPPEDLVTANPKRERIKHASLIAGKLPKPFSTHTPREMQVLAHALAFRQRWLAAGGGGFAAAAGRMLPPVTLLNECGAEKAVCMTLRPLPHTELHDLADVAQFVSEFFAYKPLEDLSQPPTHLVSPWSLLEWQAGDSFDLAALACSLLLGAGYNAFVVAGYASSKQVALGDQSRSECPWLAEHGLEAPPYAELAQQEPSFEGEEDVEEQEAAAGSLGQAACTAGQAGSTAAAAAAGMAPGAAAEGAGGDQTPLPETADGEQQQPGAATRPATAASGPAGSVAASESRPATAKVRPGTKGTSRPGTGLKSAAASRPATSAKSAAGSRPATSAKAAAAGKPGIPATKAGSKPATPAAKAGSKPATPATKAGSKPASPASKGKAGSKPASPSVKSAAGSQPGTPSKPGAGAKKPTRLKKAAGSADTPAGSSGDASAAPDAAAAGAEAAADGEVPTQAEQPAPAESAAAPPPAPVPAPRRRKRYVHAFVLVKPGRRDVMQTTLLDPATGRLYSVEAAPCSGVEVAWNDKNFWVNLQTDSAGSEDGGGSGLAELALMDWQFSNPNCWLPLLVSKEDNQLETATIATQLSMHSSRASELMGRPHPGADGRSSSALLSRLSTHCSSKGMSPRSLTITNSASTAAAAAAAAGAAVSGGLAGPAGPASGPATSRGTLAPGGVALQHLAHGARSGTPRLSVYAPTREPLNDSMAFLSPEETALQRTPGASSAGLPSTLGHHSASSLLPVASSSAGSPAVPGGTSPVAASAGLAPASTGIGGIGAGPASVPSSQGPPLPPEMPLSWVPPLGISRERLDMRCPRGQKVVVYRQARHELFARFGECGRWDGLVERVTTYDHNGAPQCVLELFSRRRDRLVRRLARPTQRLTLSSYEPGALGCVKTIQVVRGMGLQRQMELGFYAESRADGLIRRQRVGALMEEWFLPNSRPDGLLHCAIRYSSGGDSPGGGPASRLGSPGGLRGGGVGQPGISRKGSRRRSSVVMGWELQEQAVASIVEEFNRSSSQAGQAAGAGEEPAGTSAATPATAGGQQAAGARRPSKAAPAVLERRFDLLGGQLHVVMEGEGGQQICRTYGQDGELLESAGPDTGQTPGPTPSPEQQRREHYALSVACRAAQAAALASEEESREILQSMQRQEQGTALVTAHWDAMRVKVEDSDSAEVVPEEEDDSYDFLQHFLPHTGARDLTAAEAEDAKAACLLAFDDRQAERLRLLSSRLAESGAELARLQAVLSSELHHLAPADQERVRSEEAAAAFRLRVVQRRVGEHAPAAAAKRRELEGRLAADRRLAVALAGGSGN